MRHFSMEVPVVSSTEVSVPKDLHWLPIKYRVIFKIIPQVFKVLHGLAPSYLKNLIRALVKPEGRHHLRNKDHFFGFKN